GLGPRRSENHSAESPETPRRGVSEAGPTIRRYYQPVRQHKNGFAEIDIEQRLRCRELKDSAILVQPIEPALAQIEQPDLRRVRNFLESFRFSVRRTLLRPRPLLFFRLAGLRCRRLEREEHV